MYCTCGGEEGLFPLKTCRFFLMGTERPRMMRMTMVDHCYLDDLRVVICVRENNDGRYYS